MVEWPAEAPLAEEARVYYSSLTVAERAEDEAWVRGASKSMKKMNFDTDKPRRSRPL